MPYPNEHACRVEDPSDFVRFRRDNDKSPNVIIGFRRDGSSAVQAFRYPTSSWSAPRARKHCRDHDGRFEKASSSSDNAERSEPDMRDTDQTPEPLILQFAAGGEPTSCQIVDEHRFRKQILKRGDFAHPQDPDDRLIVDQDLLERIIFNFDRDVVDRVWLRWGHPDTDLFGFVSGTEAKANVGFVERLEITDVGLDAIIVSSDEEAIEKMKTNLTAVSVGIRSVTKEETGDIIWPVLDHVALVSVPYLKGMEEFEPVAAGDSETPTVLIFADAPRRRGDESHKKGATPMPELTIEGAKAFLVKCGIDLDGLKTRAEKVETAESEAKAVKAQLADIGKVVGAKDGDDIVATVRGVIEKGTELEDRVKKLVEKEIATEVDVLIADGKITPAQKETAIAMFGDNAERARKHFSMSGKVLDLKKETGTADKGNPPKAGTEDAQSEEVFLSDEDLPKAVERNLKAAEDRQTRLSAAK